MLFDPSGRLIDHLRISLTDRCNFRCRYCYPPNGVVDLRARLLDLDEFTRVARIGTQLGIRRIKLTGGEPLLSPHVITLTGRLAAMPGLDDLSLTTNGSRLRLLAGPLHDAGLRRINLSIDSLIPERFAEICVGGDLHEVLAGFREARRVGLDVKVNTVALRGWNADELGAFVRFAAEEQVEVRFIEFMPLCGQGWDKDQFVSAGELRERLERHTTLETLPSDGVARRFRTGTGARIGFIPTMSEPFCEGCRRIRLTAWGALRSCLFSEAEVDLRGLLRGGADDEAIAGEFRRAVGAKPASNPVLAGADGSRLLIRSVGG